MILVDSSVWIDHLHRTEPSLVNALDAVGVAQHPMVLGELALGSLRDRSQFLELLRNLPQVQSPTHDEVMFLVEGRSLYGRGLSLVDAHLLAATLLTPGTSLWTRDKGLRLAAEELEVAYARD